MTQRKAYADYVAEKLSAIAPTGLASVPELGAHLFPFQRDLVAWALRRGRCAIFADTGLGKTRMELEWARCVYRHTQRNVLILAPLAVAKQTEAEGRAIGIPVTLCRSQDDVDEGINVTNYERLHRFDASTFGAVVLDESSCIKHFESKTLGILLDAFGRTPFKLCATATPAPNDYTELGTHAEFLGVCRRMEMLAEFFCHDGGETQTWRLKGHARKVFWRWVASWGALVRLPSDLGYPNDGYILPAMHVEKHTVKAPPPKGLLFADKIGGLSERRSARKQSLPLRVERCAAMVNAEPAEPWIVWCDLNAEADALLEQIPGAVEVRGPDTIDDKEQALEAFAAGKIRVLISKPSICGWGLNWQHVARVAFVGVTDSWESYYQAVRRCWRFGQKREVKVHIFASDVEGSVVANLERKGADARRMADELSAETREVVQLEVCGQARDVNEYRPEQKMRLPGFIASTEGVCTA